MFFFHLCVFIQSQTIHSAPAKKSFEFSIVVTYGLRDRLHEYPMNVDGFR